MFKKLTDITNPEVLSMANLKDGTNPFQFLLLTDQKRFSEMSKEMMQLNELLNTYRKNVHSDQELMRQHIKHRQQKVDSLLQQLRQLMEAEDKECLRVLEEFEVQISQQQQQLENEQSDSELNADLVQSSKCLALLEHSDKTEKCKCSRQNPKEIDHHNELGTQVFQCLQNLRLLEEDTG